MSAAARSRADWSLSTMLARSADRAGGRREAVRFGDTSLDYAALRARSVRLANGLAAHGVGRGDRVAVLLRNRLEWPEILFGVTHLGAICVSVNVLLGSAEAGDLCADAEVAAVITDREGCDKVDALPSPPRLAVTLDGGTLPAQRVVAYGDLLAHSTDGEPACAAGADPAALYYSSGTTGLPKGVVHTHVGILWNSVHQIADLGITDADVYLVLPSLSWAAGFHDLLLATWWAGGQAVLMPTGGTTAGRVARAAAAHGVTKTLLVPTLLKQLLGDSKAMEELRGSRLRYVLTGAEPVPVALIEEFQQRLPAVSLVQGYGLSEFPTIATILREDEAVRRAGWAGRPTSICRLAVMREDGVVAATGSGEVLLQSPATTTGYWRRPAETAEALRGGWLHTGDLGEVDDEGFLRITGRKRDLIISGGVNVAPAEVEQVLHELPCVQEAAVVGVPDDRWGEAVAAVVVPRGAVDPEAVIAFCRQRLATYKVPRYVLVREGLPRNPSGKVLKRELGPWAAREAQGGR